jgi:hypothetical protein
VRSTSGQWNYVTRNGSHRPRRNVCFPDMDGELAFEDVIDLGPGARRCIWGGAVADDQHHHRALPRRGVPRRADGHRLPAPVTGFNLVLTGQWADSADTDVDMQWVRDTIAALQP